MAERLKKTEMTRMSTHIQLETKSDRTRGREGMMRHINELMIRGIQNI